MTDISLVLLLLPKVLVATLCGVMIGWEREKKNKTAGIRTHVLICVGVALFSSIGFLIDNHTVDPTRIIGQIVTGIGFLGGGVIFKVDDRVYGVTSAAFIWFISSLGVLIGVGYYITPLFFAFGLLILLKLLEILERKIK